METPPFLVSMLVNQTCYAKTNVDSGCLAYSVIHSCFVQRNNLQRIRIDPRPLSGYDGGTGCVVEEIAIFQADLNGHVQERVYAYIVPKLGGCDVIMGLPWIVDQEIKIDPRARHLRIGFSQTEVPNLTYQKEKKLDCVQVSAAVFGMWTKRRKQDTSVQVFSATMADIDKALRIKTHTDPRTKLPQHYWNWLNAFDQEKAEQLPPLRGKDTDHQITLDQKDGKDAEVPWGPLYNMSREELLVLRKTLTELLDKQFIRVSKSPAAAPVLFVKKPGGGLRFCVDYRGLNKITRKDRYPLPLIQETLRNIGKAKWFTKLDVIAAFHKIRIAEGDEWKTAFRTRYGLFEWMVTPFGLANAPSTFQRYINWALKDYLDDFCSAYVDDILVYTDGTLKEHQEHVKKVLEKLSNAGLQLDIDKCEFEVHSTKYLGFIIEAGKGIRMDPLKVEAILKWEAPKSVKGVQSFLGFANFYRQFIKNYSEITVPITSLVRKDAPFKWTDEANKSFERLKHMFTTAPVLMQFNAERETIVETDASMWSIGGTLMQYDEEGVLRPCAYYSKKNNPAECNYEIYDKEMLAIVRCLEEWDAELRSVEKFVIHSDHKNLEYFMTTRKLSERQMRWSLILSQYNFAISYVPGSQNERADALSRREQDAPEGEDDDRVKHRMALLLKPEKCQGTGVGALVMAPVHPSTPDKPIGVAVKETTEVIVGESGNKDIESLWKKGKEKDLQYPQIVDCVREGRRTFPTDLKLKVSISECSLDRNGMLEFRGRKWVPDWEPLRTGLMQELHDSVITGHPGKEAMSALMARQFFWPGIMTDIRRFVRNCDKCGANKTWRERKSGFLKPLPIPSQVWKEISMDFVTDLVESDGCKNLLVITDRLSKGTIMIPMTDIKTETVCKEFIKNYYRLHGLPRAIVSDRGTQFVNHFWKRICQLLKITRRLSTAFHPETDGSTERMNTTLEEFIRSFVDLSQENWAELMPMAELAINNRDAASTQVSPFFLAHGYHMDPIQVAQEDLSPEGNATPIQRADQIVKKIQRASEWAQMAMALAQQRQEEAANRIRQQAPNFRVGDKVWLSLKNVKTTRPNKKLDAQHAKYTVIEVIGSHSFRLDTPPGIHNVFHSDKLKLAATDPFPSQEQTDPQPSPRIVSDQEEYEVDEIVGERQVARGRGMQHQYQVKWTGYQRPTWEPATAFQETAALDRWERRNKGGGA